MNYVSIKMFKDIFNWLLLFLVFRKNTESYIVITSSSLNLTFYQ